MHLPQAPVHGLALRVYAADTDASGVVHHARYLEFAERARTEMLRAHGIALESLGDVAAGYWIVADARLRFAQPARLDDELVIETRLAAPRGASCDVEQRVRRGGVTLVDISLRLAFLGPDGRPARMAPAWRAAMAALACERWP